jgi:NADH-quinone oxidoreductase subunit G
MCDEGRHSFPALQRKTRLTAPLPQGSDRLAPESWESAIRRAAERIKQAKSTTGQSVGAVIDAHATNEEAFALKRMMSEVIGSDLIGALSFSPPGSSGDDNLLIRANKNPNTRGLMAIGIEDTGLKRIVAAIAEGQLKVLIVLRADLVRALGEDQFTHDFGALDYMVVLDTDANETCQMANQVLPIAAYTELDGSFTNFAGRVQRLDRAFDPPGQALQAIEVIARLTEALGHAKTDRSAELVFAAMASAEPAFKGLTLAGLGGHGADLAK